MSGCRQCLVTHHVPHDISGHRACRQSVCTTIPAHTQPSVPCPCVIPAPGYDPFCDELLTRSSIAIAHTLSSGNNMFRLEYCDIIYREDGYIVVHLCRNTIERWLCNQVTRVGSRSISIQRFDFSSSGRSRE